MQVASTFFPSPIEVSGEDFIVVKNLWPSSTVLISGELRQLLHEVFRPRSQKPARVSSLHKHHRKGQRTFSATEAISRIKALPHAGGLARKADGTPTNKTQRNFTDADSHLMQSGGSYLQGYKCQLAVDSDHQVIVAVGVNNQPPDVEHLEPMLQRIATTAGALPEVMTLDAGYWSEDNASRC